MQGRLALRRAPDDPGAFRREGPFVQIADIPVDAERRHVEGQLAWRMRPVHRHRHAMRAADRRHLGDRQYHRAGRGDVVEAGEARPFADRGSNRRQQRRRVGERHRHVDRNDPRADALGMVAQRVADRAIDLRQADELGAGFERQRSDDRVEPRSRILDECPILPPPAQKSGNPVGRPADEAGQVAAEKGARVGLHAGLPRAHCLQHDSRRRAIAAVVQVLDAVGEQEIAAADMAELREVAQRREAPTPALPRKRGRETSFILILRNRRGGDHARNGPRGKALASTRQCP